MHSSSSGRSRLSFQTPRFAGVAKRTSARESIENDSEEEDEDEDSGSEIHKRKKSKHRHESSDDEEDDEEQSNSDSEGDSDKCIPMSEAQLNRHSRVSNAMDPISNSRHDMQVKLNRLEMRKTKEARTQAQATNGSQASHSTARPQHTRYFRCLWRVPQTKKHKTWDGDAYLVLASYGNRLVDTDKKATLAQGFKMKSVLNQGDLLVAGGKEIEIDREIKHDEYQTGRAPEPKRSVQPKPRMALQSRTPQRESVPQFKVPSMSSGRSQGDVKMTSSKSSRPSLVSSTDRPQAIPAAQFYSKMQSDTERSDGVRPAGLFNEGDGDIPHPKYEIEEGSIVMKRPDKAHQKAFNKKRLSVVDVLVNPILAPQLRPHQEEGVRFLYERVTGLRCTEEDSHLGAILADEMGLGKTLQTITVIDMLLNQNCYYSPNARTIDRALIVCPVSVVRNWEREFKKWLGPKIKVQCLTNETKVESTINGKYQVLIIGYDKLLKVKKQVEEVQPGFGLLVCDEAHRLKNLASKTTQVLNSLDIDRRILLSGTPIQNNLSEFHAMCDMVSSGILGEKKVFKELFEAPILKSRMPHCSKADLKAGKERSEYLAIVTQGLLLRRTADILSDFLPPKYEQVVFCSPSELQIKVYRRSIRSEYIRDLLNGSTGNQSVALSIVGLLRKLCNSPELLIKSSSPDPNGDGTSIAKLMLAGLQKDLPNAVTNDKELSGKMICVVKMLRHIRDNTNDKVVLVSNFTATLNILEAICRKQKFTFVRLDGQTKASERSIIINSFNKSEQDSQFIFLLSSKAGGTGINLIGANRLILFDSDWNPATDRQAMARIHRDGQKKTCYIYRMVIPGTMDEKIYQRQISKLSLSDAMVDNDGKMGKNTESFSPKELREIFKLHLDTPCLSHDQMKCRCNGNGIPVVGEDEVEGASDAEVDSSDDDEGIIKKAPHSTFVKASQVQVDHEEAVEKNAELKLAALLRWAHHDCTSAKFESTKDEVINAIVSQQHVDGIITREEAEEDDCQSDDGSFDMTKTRAGSILYVYAQLKSKEDKLVEIEDSDED